MIKDTLAQLIRIQSYSGQEEAIASWILDWLASRGIKAQLVEKNIHLFIGGHKPSRRCLIFNGHMDTVLPGDVNHWRYPPSGESSGVVQEGKIYGCGASDMKASLAVFMHLAELLTQSPCEHDVVFSFVTEEETSGAGSVRYLKFFQNQLRADYDEIECIVAEPTDNSFIEAGSRGTTFLELAVEAQSEHAARVADVEKTAISRAMEGYRRVSARAEKWRATHSNDLLGPPSVIPTAFLSGESSYNQTPAGCKVRWDIRTTPTLDGIVLKEMTDLLSDLGRVRLLAGQTPPSYVSLEARIIKVIKEVGGDFPVLPAKGANDTCWFTAAGINAVCFGPGSKMLIHKANEYADLKEVEKGLALFESIARHW
jgi:acetylornithine deacetylase/succinyl-diaminopimelate desuccinylase-like protein